MYELKEEDKAKDESLRVKYNEAHENKDKKLAEALLRERLKLIGLA
jgi:hypothetical protein